MPERSARFAGRELAALALLGAATAALETLFAREVLVAFGGNELVLAAVLGPWLGLTALGALLGARARAETARSRAAVVLAAWALSALASLVLARILPRAFPLGAAPGVSTALLASALLLAPACVLSGAAFALLAPHAGDRERAAGRAYLADSAGSALAGAALSLFLLGRVPSLALGACTALLAVAASALALPRRALWLVPVGALAALGTVLPLDRWAHALASPELSIQSFSESPRGSIVVSTRAGETSVLFDQRPIATSTDRSAAEELVHVPLALTEEPRRVAVLGVPPVGSFALLRAHGVARIDWFVEDPVLLDVLQRSYPDFAASGVHAEPGDVRQRLAERTGAYDALLVVSGEPTTAQENRNVTRELFEMARRSLAPRGVITVGLPGHAAYASESTRRLHSALRATLASVFPSVSVVPLERALYLARRDAPLEPAELAPTTWSERLAERKIAPLHTTRAILAELASPERMREAERWASLDEPPNTDLRPTSYRLVLERTNAELGGVGPVGLGLLGALVLLFAFAAIGPRARPLELAVLTSGASGLAAELVVLVAYQIAVGALYGELGLLLAGFLLGAAAGAALGSASTRARRVVLAFDLAELGLLLAFAAALPWFVTLGGTPARVVGFTLALAVGLVPGAQLAAAGRVLGREASGALYAADLAGAAVASLVALTLVVPALGLAGALVAFAGLKLVSTTALALPAPRGQEPRASSLPLLGLVFVGFVALVVAEKSQAAVYAFSFTSGYRWAAVAGLIAAMLAAYEPESLRHAFERLARGAARLRARIGSGGVRSFFFLLLLPVAASPLGRCYFRVPFVFCHVCPRQCVFGVMRPYVVPAALIANLAGHRFCESVCPIGTAQASLEHVPARRARRVGWLWALRALALGLVVLAYYWAWSEHPDGVQGGPFFTSFFKNAFSPSLWVLGIGFGLLALSLLVRRPFCDALCPIGATSALVAWARRARSRATASLEDVADRAPVVLARRRQFLQKTAAGAGAALLGGEAISELALGLAEPALGVGFRNDAPKTLDRFARPAAFAVKERELVRCELCPHTCVLGENDRGFCRTRVVKNGRLYTEAYGNLCALHLDPIEKKPLYHFHPKSSIVSVAMGGCNLRCLNCQNWEISQSRPEDVAALDVSPEALAKETTSRAAPAIAYTYTEPLVAYEYVRDSALAARAQGIQNVLVTAGYINERPLRELARVIDAATLDVKAFRDSFYREVSGGRLAPVLRTLEVLKEEGVWTEVSYLMVSEHSDDPNEVGEFARWLVAHLGPGTPFHVLRFHAAHRLEHLPPTPVSAMEAARARAMDAGLRFVYLGNVPGHDANHTRCPRDGRILIERQGFEVVRNELSHGRCPCGEPIPGVFEP